MVRQDDDVNHIAQQLSLRRSVESKLLIKWQYVCLSHMISGGNESNEIQQGHIDGLV